MGLNTWTKHELRPRQQYIKVCFVNSLAPGRSECYYKIGSGNGLVPPGKEHVGTLLTEPLNIYIFGWYGELCGT